MERWRKYLDPVAAMVGVVSAGTALALGLPAPVATAIGLVASAIADSGQIRASRRPSPSEPARTGEWDDRVKLHPEEAQWVRRAEAALAAIRQGIHAGGVGPLADRLQEVAADAQRVLDDIRRLSIQVSATRTANRRLDVPQLSTDLTRLTATLEHLNDPEMERDVRRSVEAVREQLRIGDRLTTACTVLQARIEAGALGLQRLAAQVGEMTALAPSGGSWGQGRQIDELTTQLEALRAGLSDADAMSQRALGAMDPEGGDDVPIAP